MQINMFTITVRDYGEAIDFYTRVLGWRLLEDTDRGEGKRWVRVAPEVDGPSILLAKAVGERQLASVGNQTGGRVFMFLHTDDFWHEYRELSARGVVFVREPVVQPYGIVGVFQDLYGNLFDLIGPA
jgi:predicted enzyme related to lactoylglutathione lyase